MRGQLHRVHKKTPILPRLTMTREAEKRRMSDKTVRFDSVVSVIYYVIPESHRLRPIPRRTTRAVTVPIEKTSQHPYSIEAKLLPWLPESN